MPGFRRIQTAIDMFGVENVIVRPFDRARFVDGELLPDFLNAIEAPAETRKGMVMSHKNTGASAIEIALIDNLVTRRPDIDKSVLKDFKTRIRGFAGAEVRPAARYAGDDLGGLPG